MSLKKRILPFLHFLGSSLRLTHRIATNQRALRSPDLVEHVRHPGCDQKVREKFWGCRLKSKPPPKNDERRVSDIEVAAGGATGAEASDNAVVLQMNPEKVH